MVTESKTVTLDAARYDAWEKALDESAPRNPTYDTMDGVNVACGDGWSVDVDLCNGEDGPWLGLTLFHGEVAIGSAEPAYSLDGDTTFEGDGYEFTIAIERGV